ncbi:hypothetical protein MNB_SUP05-5-978 [hydrothermal vent metagenome]|uniref:Uncharacterized protein n=1 Tax=hydrothermal vent metagenome TaxID=652676 RepID=A0A1W1BGG9_9ZZZZ
MLFFLNQKNKSIINNIKTNNIEIYLKEILTRLTSLENYLMKNN